MNSWNTEPTLLDETKWTTWKEKGWDSWNGMSPERQFCEFVASFVALQRPKVVIETGTGQGFTTRRVYEVLPTRSQLICFESGAQWRNILKDQQFFTKPNVSIADRDTPTPSDIGEADLCILDSDKQHRANEIKLWKENAKPGSYVIIHDTGNGHGPRYRHHRYRQLVDSLQIQGLHLPNPRGGFLGVQS